MVEQKAAGRALDQREICKANVNAGFKQTLCFTITIGALLGIFDAGDLAGWTPRGARASSYRLLLTCTLGGC
jgi:hypothetical protein